MPFLNLERKGDVMLSPTRIVLSLTSVLLVSLLPTNKTAVAQIYTPGEGVTAAPVGPENAPVLTWQRYVKQRWSVLAGDLDLKFARELPPDWSMATDIKVITSGPLWVQYTLPEVRDLSKVDTLTFWARTSESRIADYVFLVDSSGNRAWYKFALRAPNGWQQFQYFLNLPHGMDSGFRIDQVAALRFAQSNMVAGDVVTIGTPRFEWGSLSHCESEAGWYIDIGSGEITTSREVSAVGGNSSLLANLVTNSWGQADIAISRATTGARWDLSSKKTLRFFWKDSLFGVDHYVLFYDDAGRYRQWMFGNPLPGHWIEVTVELDKGYYEPFGPVDMSKLQVFEIGIFSAPPGVNVSFMLDEVSVH